MNEEINNIVNNLANKNDQDVSIKPVRYNIETDWTLAYQFYNFLNNRTTKLPDFMQIEEIINNTNSKYLSVGYGIDVAFISKLNGEDENLVITCTEPINDNLERVDKITKDNYEAYTLLNNKYYKDINIEKCPRFDFEKITELQDYLEEYEKSKNPNLSI